MPKKITDLTKTVSLSAGNELFVMVQASASRSCDISQIQDYMESNNFNADTVDSLEASQFLRSDQADTANGNITFYNTAPQLHLMETTDMNGGKYSLVADSNNFSIRYPTTGTLPYPLKINGGSGGAENVAFFTDNLTIASGGDVDIPNGELTIGSSNDYSQLQSGHIELSTTTGSSHIDFKSSAAEDYDCRIDQSNNGLRLRTGGNGSAINGIVVDSNQDVSIPNGDLTVGSGNNQVYIDDSGLMTLCDSSAYASISFKSVEVSAYDARIGMDGSDGLRFRTGGAGQDVIAMEIDSSQNVDIPNGELTIGSGNNKVSINSAGTAIEISDSNGDGYIDFKSAAAENYDCRIQQGSNGLKFYTGGDGTNVLGLNITSGGNIDLPNGSISFNNISISTNQTNLDVSQVNSIRVTTTTGSVTISGLTGGTEGQVIYIIKVSSANDLIFENQEGDGDQDIFTSDGNDLTLSTYGGVTLLCNGNDWYEVGH